MSVPALTALLRNLGICDIVDRAGIHQVNAAIADRQMVEMVMPDKHRVRAFLLHDRIKKARVLLRRAHQLAVFAKQAGRSALRDRLRRIRKRRKRAGITESLKNTGLPQRSLPKAAPKTLPSSAALHVDKPEYFAAAYAARETKAPPRPV